MLKKILIILTLLAVSPTAYLLSKPLSRTQLAAIEERLPKASLDERVKLVLLLIQDGTKKKDRPKEIAARNKLESLLVKESSYAKLRQTNLYQLGTLYYSTKAYTQAFDSFERFFKSLKPKQTAYRNLVLQSLVRVAQALNKPKLEEKYLGIFVLGLAQTSAFYKTSGGFTQLIALSEAQKNGNTKEYYPKWLAAAKKNGTTKNQKTVLTAWVNHASQPGKYNPKPFETYLAFLR